MRSVELGSYGVLELLLEHSFILQDRRVEGADVQIRSHFPRVLLPLRFISPQPALFGLLTPY